jgi:hypothetical protein
MKDELKDDNPQPENAASKAAPPRPDLAAIRATAREMIAQNLTPIPLTMTLIAGRPSNSLRAS